MIIATFFFSHVINQTILRMIGIFRELIEDKEEMIEKEFAKKGNLFSLL